MKFFDLHCDTIVKKNNRRMLKSDLNIDLERGMKYSPWYQCFAVWTTDAAKEKRGMELFEKCYKIYKEEVLSEASENFVPILTIEDLALIEGDINKLKRLNDCGVKVIALTWNDANEIGGGANCTSGITEFGKEVVKEMEKMNIIVDVSHSSEKLFFDVYEISNKPFIATHSNARGLCQHLRNLTDEQIKVLIEIKGLIGINFAPMFLKCKNPKIGDIFKHAEYFLSKGCEDILCIGADFDGTELPEDIRGIEDIEKIANYFLQKNTSEGLVNKIFFENAFKFFKNNNII